MNIFPDNEGVAFIYRLKNWWDWLKAWVSPHCNILFLDIPPTWCDKYELIRLSVFKLLVDFVEGERPNERIDWSSDERHKKAQEIFMGAYRWIKEIRPKLMEISGYNLSEWGRLRGNWKEVTLSNLSIGDSKITGVGFENEETEESKAHFLVHNVLEKFIEDMDNDTLIDIIKIRGYLWT